MKTSLRLLSFSAVVLSTQVCAQTSYKVDDAYKQMRDEIRKTITPTPIPGNWFSIAAVGAVAEADDPPAINELANFCPDPADEISRFGGIRPLDLVYEKAITGMVAPVFAETDALKKAKTYLRGPTGSSTSNEYQGYLKYQEKAAELIKKMQKAKSESESSLLFVDYNNLEKDWKVQGFKNEVEAALFQIDQAEGTFGPTHNFHRTEVLGAFRFAGDTKHWAVNSYLSPASSVTPLVTAWENPSGWYKVAFDSKTYHKESSTTSKSSSSGGFLHLGGLLIGGTKGGGSDDGWRVSDVKNYGYSFEIKRVRIIRGWLDPRVFTTAGGWTWKKTNDSKDFPMISAGYTNKNEIIAPKFSVYDNLPVDCPMIPSEMLIARNRSITLTTSRSDYNQVSSSGSSGGGGMLGGVLGGSTRSSWTTTKITENGEDVTYRIDAPGTAVIGLMSQLVGGLPAPDPNRNWPDDAWTGGSK
ncbi:hypothetical protein IVB03_21935 [Bradyrhizobium sp. 168]|uniref:hypothetical protein n=1 Tax=unclassified Bradyrhizobium TaxID=2631580 RepID=UPI001FFA22F7|nr:MULTISPECIES: hypothetical protein [unclassified Bradyrhizobium]MCK1582158.1 hypothetical protein [Bradyrhizobium sp. 168]UPK11625.1 hypothetical protein IVA93_36770 [Bradyrhizobium sp. 155]UPK19529.1 hypothetical protein IVA73_37015 [Bradyrhizobium sp. 131]